MRTAPIIGMTLAAIIVAATAIAVAVPAAGQEKVWKHGLINAKADAGIFMMVGRRDFAAKQGLKLELLEFKDDQLGLKALIAGELDSFEGGPQGVFAADAKGGDAKILGCHWIVVPHGIYAKDNITSVEQLKGKSIAVSAPNSMPNMLAIEALAKYGISDKDVSLAAVGGDRERYQALVGGVVEAAVVSNEYEPISPKNIHLLVAGRDAVPNFLRVCIVSSAKKLAERGDDAVKVSCRRNERAAFRARQQGRHRRADARDQPGQAGRSAPRLRVRRRGGAQGGRSGRCRSRPRRSCGSRSRW